MTETPPDLGGPCPCGRGTTLGTTHWTSGRLWYRAFHDGPATWHLENAADWTCADCIADAALAVASGEIREVIRQIAQEHRTQTP